MVLWAAAEAAGKPAAHRIKGWSNCATAPQQHHPSSIFLSLLLLLPIYPLPPPRPPPPPPRASLTGHVESRGARGEGRRQLLALLALRRRLVPAALGPPVGPPGHPPLLGFEGRLAPRHALAARRAALATAPRLVVLVVVLVVGVVLVVLEPIPRLGPPAEPRLARQLPPRVVVRRRVPHRLAAALVLAMALAGAGVGVGRG